MARRLMFVQLKSGYGTDRGPSWICWVDFNRSWKTARLHGRELRRFQGPDANFYDVVTEEWFWLSGPKRDRTDLRYGPGRPQVDEDAREAYEAFLDGAPLPVEKPGTSGAYELAFLSTPSSDRSAQPSAAGSFTARPRAPR